ncbi:MAG TPA: hypothetical protein VK667_07750 [Ktedonobacteraceae bacterium]|nr:hypothetical protein [Ktedonobacteraceae bacterium]
MATTDPFQRGGSSGGAGNGTIPGNAAPPYQGPRSVTGSPKGGQGPYGGQTWPGNPQPGTGRKGGR